MVPPAHPHGIQHLRGLEPHNLQRVHRYLSDTGGAKPANGNAPVSRRRCRGRSRLSYSSLPAAFPSGVAAGDSLGNPVERFTGLPSFHPSLSARVKTGLADGLVPRKEREGLSSLTNFFFPSLLVFPFLSHFFFLFRWLDRTFHLPYDFFLISGEGVPSPGPAERRPRVGYCFVFLSPRRAYTLFLLIFFFFFCASHLSHVWDQSRRFCIIALSRGNGVQKKRGFSLFASASASSLHIPITRTLRGGMLASQELFVLSFFFFFWLIVGLRSSYAAVGWMDTPPKHDTPLFCVGSGSIARVWSSAVCVLWAWSKNDLVASVVDRLNLGNNLSQCLQLGTLLQVIVWTRLFATDVHRVPVAFGRRRAA